MNMCFDVNEIKQTISKIDFELIGMLEIDVSNGIFVNRGIPITIDGKSINYPKIESEAGVVDKYSINYEPFINRKIAHWMFNRYAILRQMEDPTFGIHSFFIGKYLNKQDYFVAMCNTNRGMYESHPFTNESVCWIDLIYIMDNNPFDYTTLLKIDSYINVDRMLRQQEREMSKKNATKRGV